MIRTRAEERARRSAGPVPVRVGARAATRRVPRGASRRRFRARTIALALALVALLGVPQAGAQSWARLAVPDSALDAALAGARSDYENTWNALLVAVLRAQLAHADSAARLSELARRVARAEPRALGSHIAPDALALGAHWTRAERRLRVEAAVTESLAAAARAGRAWTDADSLYHGALTGYRRLAEKRREAWVLGGLGVVALGAGHSERALDVYAEALAARRALGDPRLLGNTLNDIGQIEFQLGRYESARAHLSEAAEVRERSEQLPALGATLGFLGSVMLALGQRDSAETCFARSLELTSTAGDSARTLVTLVNYGAMLMDRGEATRAVAIYDRARVIARQRDDAEKLAIIEDNLGDLERQRGRFTQAVHYQEEAAVLRADDPPGLVVTLNGLGRTLTEMGDPDRARVPLVRALALADSLGDAALAARTLTNLAFAAEASGDLGGARRLGRRAVDRAAASGDSTLVRDAAHTCGQIALAAGAPVEAGAWIDRAFAAAPDASPELRASMLVNRALAWHLEGNLDQAERAYREALPLAEEARASDLSARILTDLGDVEERRADYPAAFARYGEALAIIDTLRSSQAGDQDAVKTLAARVYVHEAIIHLLGTLDPLMPDSGYAARAFEWAERARARSLLDLAAAAAGHQGPAATVSIAQAQRLLTSDREALLEYSVGDSSTSLWVIRRSGWRLVHLPPRRALVTQLQLLRRDLGDSESADTEGTLALARAIYRVLVAPAEPLLKGVDRLVISPSGTLALIPFEALLLRDPVGQRVPRGAYLVERYRIRYTPSASALALAREANTGGGIIAVGNPSFGTASRDSSAVAGIVDAPRLAPLPNTALELESLSGLAQGRTLTVLSGADANARRVLALPDLSQAALIHLATHGDVSEAEPDRSGLWLAPDSGQDVPSRIDVSDVLRLRLSADLVTLSACQTGLGRLERGEGVIGLERAFLAAGARSVVVSLWSVNDRSTAMLMDAFYRRALTGGEDRAAALSAAKRELIAKAETRSPYYWAPFVLVGDPAGQGRKP